MGSDESGTTGDEGVSGHGREAEGWRLEVERGALKAQSDRRYGTRAVTRPFMPRSTRPRP